MEKERKLPEVASPWPSAMTDRVVERLCQALGIGVHEREAAAYAGISYLTYLKWRKKGKEDREAGLLTGYSEFLERVNEVRSTVEVGWLAELNSIAFGRKRINAKTGEEEYPTGDARTLQWLLSRRFSDRWGDKQKIEHSGPKGKSLRLVMTHEEAKIELARAAEDLATLEQEGKKI
jgi:hypothetical protein